MNREPANDFITHCIKGRESMYDHLVQSLMALPDQSVTVIDGTCWGRDSVLQIKSTKAELIDYLDLDEDGSIQTLHEIWQ